MPYAAQPTHTSTVPAITRALEWKVPKTRMERMTCGTLCVFVTMIRLEGERETEREREREKGKQVDRREKVHFDLSNDSCCGCL